MHTPTHIHDVLKETTGKINLVFFSYVLGTYLVLARRSLVQKIHLLLDKRDKVRDSRVVFLRRQLACLESHSRHRAIWHVFPVLWSILIILAPAVTIYSDAL